MDGKTVILTGASRGIGRAAAIRFASEGYSLALCCRHNKDRLDDVRDEITRRYGSFCLTFTGDMGNWEEAEQFCAVAAESLGHVDVLVNNAGISYIGLLTDMSPQEWREVMSSNLDSVFNCCRNIIPYMIHAGSGHIINVSSVWGCSGASCEAAYSASKGGVNALTQALAKELAPSGISVNAAALGTIDTEMNSCFSDEERRSLEEDIPAGRFASPDEAAEIIFRLASADPYLTGQIVKFDGGWV